MSINKYSVDGSALSMDDRSKLLQLLERHSDIGTIYVDMEKGLYEAFFDETVTISSLPFPHGTILKQIYQ